MSSNVGKKCFKLWCVLCAVKYLLPQRRISYNDVFLLINSTTL
jgi:hypothetical protein